MEFSLYFMKKQIIFLIITFSIICLKAQNNGIEFKVGLEYRITPIEKETNGLEYSERTVYFSQHRQLTGTSLSYSLAYFFRNFGVGISQSIQYSHIYYDSNNTNKSVNGLMYDFKFFIEQDFKLNSFDIFIEGGFSLMNSGTTYYSRDLVSAVGDNGEPLYYKSERDFSYFANNITIGVKFEKLDFSIGSYFAKGYLQDALSKKFILPYAKINYIIW